MKSWSDSGATSETSAETAGCGCSRGRPPGESLPHQNVGRASLRTSQTHTQIANTTSLSPKSWLKTPSASFCSLSATISDGTTGARRNQPRFHLAGPKKSPKKKVKARPALPLHAPRSTPVRAPLRSPHTEPQKQPAWQGKRSRWCWHLTRFARRFFFSPVCFKTNKRRTENRGPRPVTQPERFFSLLLLPRTWRSGPSPGIWRGEEDQASPSASWLGFRSILSACTPQDLAGKLFDVCPKPL